MNPTSHVVRYRTVSVTVFEVSKKRGLTYYRFRKGKGVVTRSTLEKAKAAARSYAEETFLGAGKIGTMSDAQTRAVRRMIEADPTLALVDEFLSWKSAKYPAIALATARDEFLAVKSMNAGKSHYNVSRLRQRLACLPDLPLASVTPANLPTITGHPRTRRNYLGAWTTFFRWCIRQGYLPPGETAPERMEKPACPRVTPAIWSRDELETLLANVTDEYLPWLALAAWAGIRTEEICPDTASDKDGVRWEDFKWETNTIEIRPEVAKTGHRRLAPILPALRAVLWPLRGSGRVLNGLPPHRSPHGGKVSETTRLGRIVKGWKRNALRHSFISYRSAQVGTMQAALDAGNSESVTRRNYQDAVTATDAEAWFDLPPWHTKGTQRFSPLRVATA